MEKVKVIDRLDTEKKPYVFTGETWGEAHQKADAFIKRLGGGDRYAIVEIEEQ